jgi:hypothetical protein
MQNMQNKCRGIIKAKIKGFGDLPAERFAIMPKINRQKMMI